MEILEQLLEEFGAGGDDAALADELAREDQLLMIRLIEARIKSGLSQEALAEKLGVSQAAVSKFERLGNDPRLSTIRRYALALGALVRHQVDDDPDLSSEQGTLSHFANGAFSVTTTDTASAAFRKVRSQLPAWPSAATAPAQHKELTNA